MFRDLLQKPWFVGLLSIMALAAIYINVVEPLLEDKGASFSAPAKRVVASFSSIPDSVVEPDSIKSDTIRHADWQTLARVSPDRNPFAPSTAVRKKTKGRTYINWPTVSAVVIGSGEKFAIVDGNVVQEGKKSGKFRIVKISANSVRVRYKSREKTLTVNARGGR